MTRMSLVQWEISRKAVGPRTGSHKCPSCRMRSEWSAVEERRRLRVLGAGVGPWTRNDLVACRECGCALPAGWREAQLEPSSAPSPN